MREIGREPVEKRESARAKERMSRRAREQVSK